MLWGKVPDMDLHFPPQQNYDCVQCGRGCQMSWDIPVEDPIEAQLRDHPLTLRVIQEKGGSPLLHKKDGWVMQVDPGEPRCGYLESDLLCSIHKHIGVEAKPLICRLYPMILTHTPEGIFVGSAYSCTAVRLNSGRNLAAHRADIEHLIQRGAQLNRVGADGLLVHGQWFTDWSSYRRFEEQICQQASQLGWARALGQAALALALAAAKQPRSRSGTPQAWPDDTWPELAQQAADSGRFQPCQSRMWEAIIPHLKPDLLGVEPALRPAYRQAVARLEAMDEQQLDRQSRPLVPELELQIERYLQHLVFRKQLVMHPTLLSNLGLLAFLPAFLRRWTRALATEGEGQLDDFHWAQDLCEKFLVYHSHSLRPTYQKVARQWVQLLADESEASQR